MRQPYVLVLAGLLGVVTDCARPAPANPAASDPNAAQVALMVENHHWLDMTIYLVHDGIAERVGNATGTGNSTFFLPGRKFTSGTPVRLRADPIGMRGTYTSENLLVRPGQVIRWTLEAQLAQSTASVF